ncbi:MAG: NAD(P)-dependent glycerol-3-phosphate dehydrogenase [Candidatus Competibacteraceae bacterium]|nr:NAD(P)-dependent glycerol-3-phosphate dehydrogenase [Candidatus Competibacteraceae bacterium]MCB1805142.1 NAD(P)-dependent glycerol-3-phosphate dehydrogenase [Candidatus Competibacteraceae bacterium]
MASNTVAVLGAGSWGTALALQLARTGQQVRLWGHNPAHIAQLQTDRCNTRYLPDAPFPDNLQVQDDLATVSTGVDYVLVVVPSSAFGDTLLALRPHLQSDTGFCWATKGLEHGSGRFLHQLVSSTLLSAGGHARHYAVISGPSFAREVAAGLPTALTIASPDQEYAHQVAHLLHGQGMLTYISDDVVGVELGGAIKNVLAIAAGISDGLGFGANARAALITRGLAELVRLGDAAGGKRETFMGLTGLGDLMLTCTDNQSRNRRFGLAIGQGQSPAQAKTGIGQVVEGANTVHEIMRLARHYKVKLPICEQVELVLHHGLPPRQAVENLLSRPPNLEYR